MSISMSGGDDVGSLVQWSREAENGGLLSRVPLVRFQQGPRYSRKGDLVSRVAVTYVLAGSSPAPGAYGTESKETRKRTST